MNEHRGLWRGKRVDNGEWVQGYYICISGCHHFIYTGKFVCGANEMIHHPEMLSVDPSTLGECTGLRDKNGKLIFEGDIVTYGDTDNRYYGNYAVVFEQRGWCAYFGIKINDNETWQFCLEVHPKIMEVIGNIHDNSEMLNTTGEDIGNAAQDTIAPAT